MGYIHSGGGGGTLFWHYTVNIFNVHFLKCCIHGALEQKIKLQTNGNGKHVCFIQFHYFLFFYRTWFHCHDIRGWTEPKFPVAFSPLMCVHAFMNSYWIHIQSPNVFQAIHQFVEHRMYRCRSSCVPNKEVLSQLYHTNLWKAQSPVIWCSLN